MVGEAETVAETEEADPTTEEAGPEPKEAGPLPKEAEGGVAPDTLTTLPARPVTSTGNSERLLGTVPTAMAVHGETLNPPNPVTTATSWHQKQK